MILAVTETLSTVIFYSIWPYWIDFESYPKSKKFQISNVVKIYVFEVLTSK